MLLYHHTCQLHLRSIMKDQSITRTESNVVLGTPDETNLQHVGPDVVWLTSQPSVKTEKWNQFVFSADGNHYQEPPTHWQKGRIRVVVNVNYARRWRQWAKEQGSTPETIKVLHDTGGDSYCWWVSERDIPIKHWVRIDDTDTMKCLYHSTTGVTIFGVSYAEHCAA